MKENLAQIIINLKQLLNTDLIMFNDSFLIKILKNRIKETASKSAEEYCSFLIQNKEEQDIFINALYNNYSIFFRNPYTFSVLENNILPKLIQNLNRDKERELRIWSSACASGQETYSLAILLEELNNGSFRKFSYRIFGTDISEFQIKTANKGEFKESVLDNLTLKNVKSWFDLKRDIYTIKPTLKKKISFSVFDLFSDQVKSPPASIFGSFDIIYCANLLFYFKEEYQDKILKKIKDNLAKGGYVITGKNERGILIKHNFKEVISRSGIFRLK